MEQVIVSGGKIKFRIKLKPGDLMQLIGAKAADLVK